MKKYSWLIQVGDTKTFCATRSIRMDTSLDRAIRKGLRAKKLQIRNMKKGMNIFVKLTNVATI